MDADEIYALLVAAVEAAGLHLNGEADEALGAAAEAMAHPDR